MPRVIKTHKLLAAHFALFLQIYGFRPRHIGLKAPQKHDRWQVLTLWRCR